MNTYGGCNKPTIEIQYSTGFGEGTRITTNFCSDKCRKLYKGDLKGKKEGKKSTVNFIVPPRKEFLKTFGKGKFKQTFLYNPWERKYYQYIDQVGIIDDLGRIFVKEDTEYFKVLKKICNNIKVKLPERPPSKPVVNNNLVPWKKIEKEKLPKGLYKCNTCGHNIKVIGKITNQIICPICRVDISHKYTKEQYDEMFNKNKENIKIKTGEKEKTVKPKVIGNLSKYPKKI